MDGVVSSLDSRLVPRVIDELSQYPGVFAFPAEGRLPCHRHPERHDGIRAASVTGELIAYRCGHRWWARVYELLELPPGRLEPFDVLTAPPVDVTGPDGSADAVANAVADLLGADV
ncbi:hypothetical protein [Agromyces humi]|uniref:hypothetical protein n=1 Tax=Agromyces humi TaxID=1766800 RepID=UPI00135C275B|nr:hypothetical protein [Agromyces humi]